MKGEQLNYQKTDIGLLKDLSEYSHILPDSKLEMKGKVFLNDLVGLTGSEISFNAMLPKESMPFYHKHTYNEEVYIILSGIGEFIVDDEVIAVKEGSVIRMNPEAVRSWRNISETENLTFITIQTKANSMDSSKPTSDGVVVR